MTMRISNSHNRVSHYLDKWRQMLPQFSLCSPSVQPWLSSIQSRLSFSSVSALLSSVLALISSVSALLVTASSLLPPPFVHRNEGMRAVDPSRESTISEDTATTAETIPHTAITSAPQQRSLIAKLKLLPMGTHVAAAAALPIS